MRSLSVMPFGVLVAAIGGIMPGQSIGRQIESISSGPRRRIKFSSPVPKSRVRLNSLIRACPGGSHGIFDTSIGPVRKSFDATTIDWVPAE
jgi:hypothetical protein